MHTLDTLDAASLRSDIPAFRAGDTVKVHVRVVEGNRSRIQVFQGIVIRRSGGGIRETFTVRKVSFGVGVERTFPVHTPIVDQIEVVTRGDVRRAKLYYLRSLRGKAAKIKEKRDNIPAPLRRAGIAASHVQPGPVPSSSCQHRASRGRRTVVRTLPSAPLTSPASSSYRRLLLTLLAAAVVVVLVRVFLVQTFVIPSGSMEPGLQVGDRVVVSRLDYRFGRIRRGDVVVFDGDGVFAAAAPPRSALARGRPDVGAGARRTRRRVRLRQAGHRPRRGPRGLLRRAGADHRQRSPARRAVRLSRRRPERRRLRRQVVPAGAPVGDG